MTKEIPFNGDEDLTNCSWYQEYLQYELQREKEIRESLAPFVGKRCVLVDLIGSNRDILEESFGDLNITLAIFSRLTGIEKKLVEAGFEYGLVHAQNADDLRSVQRLYDQGMKVGVITRVFGAVLPDQIIIQEQIKCDGHIFVSEKPSEYPRFEGVAGIFYELYEWYCSG